MNHRLFLCVGVFLICQPVASVAFAMAQNLPGQNYGNEMSSQTQTRGSVRSPRRPVAQSPRNYSTRPDDEEDCPTPRSRGRARRTASDMDAVLEASSGSGYAPLITRGCRIGRRGWGVHRHPIVRGKNHHRVSRMHTGQDIPAPSGTPVRAPMDGSVIGQGRSGGYGNLVTMRLDNGLTIRLAHLSRFGSSGRVRKGEIIGYVGSSGLSTGPHLHFEVMRGGQLVNPAQYFKRSQMCARS